MKNVDGLILQKHKSLLHTFVLFQPQGFRFLRKEAENYIHLTYLHFFFYPTLYNMFLLDDFWFPAYFVVNNACWDLVRRVGKRNCAKWKKGMPFSVDERQIRGRKNKYINQNNGTTGQNMQRWRRTQCKWASYGSSNKVIIYPHLSQQLIWRNTLKWTGKV